MKTEKVDTARDLFPCEAKKLQQANRGMFVGVWLLVLSAIACYGSLYFEADGPAFLCGVTCLVSLLGGVGLVGWRTALWIERGE